MPRVTSRWSGALALLILVLLAIPSGASAENGKLGVIDSQRIFAEYQDARDAEAVFQEEMRQWRQELEEMERNILSQQEKIRSQALLLTKEKLDDMQSTLDQQMQTYDTRKEALFNPTSGQAVVRNQELSDPINRQITTVVERLGAEGSFDMILDLATVNVVYLGDGVDLTDQVLEELEKGGN